MQTLTERMQLGSDENIIRVVRKHWFILLRDTIGPILLFLAPLVAYFFIKDRLFEFEAIAALRAAEHADAALLFFISWWGLLMWLLVFFVWTDFYLDMWTLTNRRIIAIDQRGFFRRVIASFRLERLQDISVEIHGMIATLLDFGDLRAQTAGHDVEFTISGVPHPREIKKHIFEIIDHVFRARKIHSHEPKDE